LLCQPQFIPVFAGYYHGFYRFFSPSWQKYFLPWQKPNPAQLLTHSGQFTVNHVYISGAGQGKSASQIPTY